MSRLEKARTFRKQIEANLTATRSMIRIDELAEQELKDIIDLYPLYQINYDYKVGQIIKYNDTLYEIRQAHTSQEDWIPADLPEIGRASCRERV